MVEIPPVTTVLVAVNDSPAAFAAAEVAVAYTARLGAHLRAVTVVGPVPIPVFEGRTEAVAQTGQLEAEADSVLRHVLNRAAMSGVEVTTSRRTGAVAAEILDEARVVTADLIVMASVDRPGHALPKVGSHTMRVLEFASVPVLVVPGPTTPVR